MWPLHKCTLYEGAVGKEERGKKKKKTASSRYNQSVRSNKVYSGICKQLTSAIPVLLITVFQDPRFDFKVQKRNLSK